MFILTGNIESGLPSFQPPPFSMNSTLTGQVISFKDMLAELGSGIVIIPLIAILESVAIAKSFGNFNLDSVELLSQVATSHFSMFEMGDILRLYRK